MLTNCSRRDRWSKAGLYVPGYCSVIEPLRKPARSKPAGVCLRMLQTLSDCSVDISSVGGVSCASVRLIRFRPRDSFMTLGSFSATLHLVLSFAPGPAHCTWLAFCLGSSLHSRGQILQSAKATVCCQVEVCWSGELGPMHGSYRPARGGKFGSGLCSKPKLPPFTECT